MNKIHVYPNEVSLYEIITHPLPFLWEKREKKFLFHVIVVFC